MIREVLKFSELTSRIIGCVFQVHKMLGSGFLELIYQRALEIEMQLAGLDFKRDFEMPIYYQNQQIGTRR